MMYDILTYVRGLSAIHGNLFRMVRAGNVLYELWVAPGDAAPPLLDQMDY